MSAAMDDEVLVDCMEQDLSVWDDVDKDAENNTAEQVPVVSAKTDTRRTNTSQLSDRAQCPPNTRQPNSQ